MRKKVRIGRAAEIAGVSVDTLRRWADKGRVKFERINGQRCFEISDVESAIRQDAQTSAAPHPIAE